MLCSNCNMMPDVVTCNTACGVLHVQVCQHSKDNSVQNMTAYCVVSTVCVRDCLAVNPRP